MMGPLSLGCNDGSSVCRMYVMMGLCLSVSRMYVMMGPVSRMYVMMGRLSPGCM